MSREAKVKAKGKGTRNPNVKYYKIPGKSQLPNPKSLVVLGFGVYLVVLVVLEFRIFDKAVNRKLYIPPLSIEKT